MLIKINWSVDSYQGFGSEWLDPDHTVKKNRIRIFGILVKKKYCMKCSNLEGFLLKRIIKVVQTLKKNVINKYWTKDFASTLFGAVAATQQGNWI